MIELRANIKWRITNQAGAVFLRVRSDAIAYRDAAGIIFMNSLNLYQFISTVERTEVGRE